MNSIIVKDSYLLIKTEPGFARTINYCIDQMHLPHVLGTVSGNDVIMVLVKSNEEAEYLKYLLLKP
ncbi:arginine repressor [Staphylococcus simulans]